MTKALGGARPGAGRPSGKDWDGMGGHKPHVRVGIMLTQEHFIWLDMQPDKRSQIIRRLIQDDIDGEHWAKAHERF